MHEKRKAEKKAHSTVTTTTTVKTMSKNKSPKKITLVSKTTEDRISKQLLENLVSLQKVQTELAMKFDRLSKDITSLLTLFEVTARNFAKNVPKTPEMEKDKEFLDKIDKLLDQNKVIAKGLMIMEDRLKERVYGSGGEENKPQPDNQLQPSMATQGRRPLPRF